MYTCQIERPDRAIEALERQLPDRLQRRKPLDGGADAAVDEDLGNSP